MQAVFSICILRGSDAVFDLLRLTLNLSDLYAEACTLGNVVGRLETAFQRFKRAVAVAEGLVEPCELAVVISVSLASSSATLSESAPSALKASS